MSDAMAKQSVNLASGEVRVSRIRRNPPPIVKEKTVDIKEREQWVVTVGVVTFALAIFVIILGFSSYFFGEAEKPMDPVNITIDG
jgi:hypothetical protein